MNYARAELADRLASEYVLGTLQGGARRRFEALLPAHPMLRQAVTRWHDRLQPLARAIPPVAPAPAVWERIEARLDGAAVPVRAPAATPARAPSPAHAPAPARPGFWGALAFWRGWSLVATAAAAVLAVLLMQPATVPPPIVVLLSAPEGANSFVASVASDGGSMVVRPVINVSTQQNRALELWAVPGQGAPRSLGLISADRPTVLRRGRLLEDTAAFAVSLEPPGGSPTGAPTGPILFTGKLQL